MGKTKIPNETEIGMGQFVPSNSPKFWCAVGPGAVKSPKAMAASATLAPQILAWMMH